MVAEQPRQLSISFDEQTLSDRLRYRDSRPLDHRFAIEEEDESTGTASEPAEPLTPTSHTSEGSPFSHPFRDDDGSVDDVFATPTPYHGRHGEQVTFPRSAPKCPKPTKHSGASTGRATVTTREAWPRKTGFSNPRQTAQRTFKQRWR